MTKSNRTRPPFSVVLGRGLRLCCLRKLEEIATALRDPRPKQG